MQTEQNAGALWPFESGVGDLFGTCDLVLGPALSAAASGLLQQVLKPDRTTPLAGYHDIQVSIGVEVSHTQIET